MATRLAVVLSAIFAWAWGAEAEGPAPRVFSADPQVLVANKAALAGGDATLRPALDHLLADANKRLDQKARSVMDKEVVPPSGDKHDFMSQAPYFWKDTNSPVGKYIRRDGVRNPEIAKISDAGAFGVVCSGAHALGLAYYFTGDEKYAAKATELLRVWFLNPATRMNPNLKFGQGIPGETEGRPTGLIGARGLADLVDGVGLLAGSKSWTPNDQQGMTAWGGDYFQWLTTSKIGLGEEAASNNHGTFYDVQAVSLALFIDHTNYAREKLLQARQKRIANQIQPDGHMPRELARTLSFNYSVFNLRAEMELADLGRNAGVDLWHYQTPDGRGILPAAEFLAPYADPQRKWPYPQIKSPNRNDLGELLWEAAAEYSSDKIKAALLFYQTPEFAANPARLYLKMAALPGGN
jgi:hypothetical protein